MLACWIGHLVKTGRDIRHNLQIFQKIAQIKKGNFQKIEILIFNGQIFIFSTQLDFLRHLVPITCDTDDLKKSVFFAFF